jgi:hypothetical protein
LRAAREVPGSYSLRGRVQSYRYGLVNRVSCSGEKSQGNEQQHHPAG